MQIPKDDIRNDILQAAGKIFQEKGFLKTSMRDIAECARVSLSNIYNYFKGKDDIFRTVVYPVTRAFENMLHEHHGRRGVDILHMQSETYLRYVVEEYIDLIHRHRPLLSLLFFRSQGSSLEKFKEEFTDKSTLLVKDYFREMKRKHPQLDINVSDFFIHLHTVWMFSMLEELIMHKVSPEDTEKIVTEYMMFEITGWRELIKI
ncbi:TetR/AcrR family transcriptional regulator [Bacteroides helcogenes]|uniref:Transcriptional regulator, TetR family n=1 Tax=Bacteroides helcogenes (strain ATCC 35417 / DSM 20613 / JCM 6297 / CCUG 15421 / P 36-108) TaxID=693979 RepID=E6STD8_BACT6|nr:TetR/AcrR family transcriptional regulator [Bacteroides helcogenes]ADV43212.1 transcriptional regulator, TetR family [Bacteroides helcogenes P 36-108]MDY5239187.1 TetR/AcrR family transcriptional regulator [Bacteroides helcogenes]